jgi:hypothetical protein
MRLKLLLVGAIAGLMTLGFLALNSHVVKAGSRTSAAAAACGGEHRWDVKTLSDGAADKVHYDKPKRHTVKYMLGRTDPHVGRTTARDSEGSHVKLTCTSSSASGS